MTWVTILEKKGEGRHENCGERERRVTRGRMRGGETSIGKCEAV